MTQSLMEKLAISKQIMDKHKEIGRGQHNEMVADVDENQNVRYNVPNDMLVESPQPRIQQTFHTTQISEDAVRKSNLPDEIKKLMIEHPIQQPQLNGPTLSDEIVEGARRLMGQKSQAKTSQQPSQQINNNELKQMIRDVVRDTVRDVVREELKEAGMLIESETKANENLVLKVGNHIFQGKILKIKKTK